MILQVQLHKNIKLLWLRQNSVNLRLCISLHILYLNPSIEFWIITHFPIYEEFWQTLMLQWIFTAWFPHLNLSKSWIFILKDFCLIKTNFSLNIQEDLKGCWALFFFLLHNGKWDVKPNKFFFQFQQLYKLCYWVLIWDKIKTVGIWRSMWLSPKHMNFCSYCIFKQSCVRLISNLLLSTIALDRMELVLLCQQRGKE